MRTALLLSMTIGLTVSTSSAQSDYRELQRLSAALNHIRNNYMDSVRYATLVEAAIHGAVRSLDPHSYFLPRRAAQLEARLAGGELGTIGVRMELVDGLATVLSVTPDGPAERQGVVAGDRLIAVNDTTVAGLHPRTLEQHLIGRKGSRVVLTLERGSRVAPQQFRVTVKRDEVKEPSVPFAFLVDDSTAYVWLVTFGPSVAEEVEDRLRQLMRRGARRAIIDLRGNPGGRVDMSIAVASLFFPEGTVVFRTRGRATDVVEDFVTERDGRFRDLPLVVLIDRRTASAAEALAGSLQDHDRAVLIGRRSFGKALMQAPFRLPQGGMLWLTVGRVLTPSGRFIQRPYRGLAAAQYLQFAGREGSAGDTAVTFTTDNGREVHGGGGIAPDLQLAEVPAPPVWYAVAADSAFVEAVADSVAATLPESEAAFAEWAGARDPWDRELREPFFDRVGRRLDVTIDIDSTTVANITSLLAQRATAVRWGADAATSLRLRYDPAMVAALDALGRLPALLAPDR